MSIIKDTIKNTIKNNKPDISASSIQTYNSILTNLYKKVFNDTQIDISKFDETDKILNYLKTITPNKRKTILSALVVITNNKKYRDQMLKDINEYNKDIGHQEKTESQKESWVEKSDIEQILNSLKDDAELLYKKKVLKISDLQQIQTSFGLLVSVYFRGLAFQYVPPIQNGRFDSGFCIRFATPL
jgi:hypothetical protein